MTEKNLEKILTISLPVCGLTGITAGIVKGVYESVELSSDINPILYTVGWGMAGGVIGCALCMLFYTTYKHAFKREN